MSSIADKNFYQVSGIVMGAAQTGISTFIRQMANGSPTREEQYSDVYYKDYDRIGGKLRVKMELLDMAKEINCNRNSTFFVHRAVVFVLFDLSRPATFFGTTDRISYRLNINVKYLMNEVATLNINPKILKFLIGTNADKADRTFN